VHAAIAFDCGGQFGERLSRQIKAWDTTNFKAVLYSSALSNLDARSERFLSQRLFRTPTDPLRRVYDGRYSIARGDKRLDVLLTDSPDQDCNAEKQFFEANQEDSCNFVRKTRSKQNENILSAKSRLWPINRSSKIKIQRVASINGIFVCRLQPDRRLPGRPHSIIFCGWLPLMIKKLLLVKAQDLFFDA
jgi:hypothetical protein